MCSFIKISANHRLSYYTKKICDNKTRISHSNNPKAPRQRNNFKKIIKNLSL